MITELKSKELGVLELFCKGLKIYKRVFIFILVIDLIPSLIIHLLIELISSLNVLFIGLILFLWILKIPSYISSVIIVENYLFEKKINLFLAFRKGIFSWISLFLVELTLSNMIGIYILLALILVYISFVAFNTINLGVPAAFLCALVATALIANFLVGRSFCYQAAVARNLGISDAVAYSKSLVQGRWWKVFLTMCSININIVFLFLFLQLPLLVHQLTVTQLNLFVKVASQSIFDFLSSFFTVVSLVFFFNLEHKKN
jgi:hypothetical protein